MNRKIYIVTYDLKHTLFRNYDGLFKALQSFPYMHYMENTWFIISERTSQDIYTILSPQLFDDCNLFIMRVNADYYGQLPNEAWDWFKQHNAYI